MLVVAFAVACGGSQASPPAQAPPSSAACARTEASVRAPEISEGLLLQSENINSEGEATGYRLFEDGRFERRRASGPWEPKEPLSAASVQGVRDAIDASGVGAAAGRHASSLPSGDATRREVWVRVDGALVALVVGDGCVVEAEQRLASAIAALLH